jgi:hypothetical protein
MAGFYIPLATNELPPSDADQDEETAPALARR